jgi:hypothetical protein
MDNTENTHINADEFSVAEKEAEKVKKDAANAGRYAYTHKFREPFHYMKKEHTELLFDWDRLTGRDAMAIEDELIDLRIPVVSPAFSSPYIIRMAAKACTEEIGADAFELMPFYDFNKIKCQNR